MEKISLKVEIREEVGKEAVGKLRREGLVPAVVYKAGGKTTNLKVSHRDLLKALHTEAGENVILTLKFPKADKKTKTVIIKELQHHPLKSQILHVDFNQISLTEKLAVDVPLETKGESIGVREGGVLEHILWELKIECLPANIPEKIDIDVTDLKIGDTLAVKNVKVPEGIKVLADPEAIVISVKPPTVEKVEEEVPEGEGITEPEVITEKKREEEPEDAEEGKPARGKK